MLCLIASPKLALLWEIQITCLSDTNVVRQPEMSRGGIPPLGPIWVNITSNTNMNIMCGPVNRSQVPKYLVKNHICRVLLNLRQVWTVI